MAYDEALADRVRARLGALAVAGVTEQRMFGGLAFLVGGHMAVAVSGAGPGGGLMVRVAHDDTERLLDEPGAAPMIMRGRPLAGWLRVAADAVGTDDELTPWVRRGAEFARSLPPKPATRA